MNDSFTMATSFPSSWSISLKDFDEDYRVPSIFLENYTDLNKIVTYKMCIISIPTGKEGSYFMGFGKHGSSY